MHLTGQTDHPKPTIFPKCWTSHNNEVNIILKYGKGSEEGEVAEHHCYSSSFISMLVCLLFISMFLSFSFCLLGCSFPPSSPLKGTTLVWMEYRITCLFVCWRLYVRCRSFLRSFLHWQGEIFKGHCSRSAPLSYGDKKKDKKKRRCYN